MAAQPVVITGMGAASPIGMGVAAFREGLLGARSGTRAVTAFDASDLPCRVAADVTEPLEPLLTGIVEGKLVRNLSRTTMMALIAGAEALGSARWPVKNSDDAAGAGVLGVWAGTGGAGVGWAEAQYEIYFRDGWRRTSPWGIVAGLPGMLSSDLSSAFGATGPSHVLSTGCTSSSDAISYATLAVAMGWCDAALAGGAEAPLTRGIFSNFCRMQAMGTSFNDRPEAASRPYDRDRDGFILGEGAWFVVLETAEAAARRGVVPLARLAGTFSTCDAHHRIRNHPSGAETARAVRSALAAAGVDPGRIGYVNLHGSATPLNDRTETLALTSVFGERTPAIPMSALKSQIGHPQGASGAAGLVATLLGMAGGFVPATINRDHPDPDCGLDVVPREPREHRFEAAVVNAISFGSKNTALVITTPDFETE
ncbi:MAG TPA: beta-ketoacyl-[acyl-carrier-protein] synthase family protein [Candidatus Eisenbacteria bacterium]